MPKPRVMPSGSTETALGGWEWRKKGGHPNLVPFWTRVREGGFTQMLTLDRSSPDGSVVAGRTRYEDRDGNILTVDQSFGVTARENRFTITYTPAKK
jgi:hypothetical protein